MKWSKLNSQTPQDLNQDDSTVHSVDANGNKIPNKNKKPSGFQHTQQKNRIQCECLTIALTRFLFGMLFLCHAYIKFPKIIACKKKKN